MADSFLRDLVGGGGRGPGEAHHPRDAYGEESSAEDFFGEIANIAIPMNGGTATPYDHTYTPASSDQNKLMVNGRAFTPPVSNFRNWAASGVYHFTNAVYRRTRSTGSTTVNRPVGDIISVTVHESVSGPIDPGASGLSGWDKAVDQDGAKSVHFIVHRDGSITQHNDVVDDLKHANDHNQHTIGIEIPNPVVPRVAGIGASDRERSDLCSRLPANLGYELLCNTTWTNRDSNRNPRRHYVLPTAAQCESATKLIGWLSDPSHGHGLGVPRSWPGLDGWHMAFDAIASRAPGPGIWAHGYHHHSDGFFNVLHAYLQLGPPRHHASLAYATAKTLAAGVSTHNRRKQADLTPYLRPTTNYQPLP